MADSGHLGPSPQYLSSLQDAGPPAAPLPLLHPSSSFEIAGRKCSPGRTPHSIQGPGTQSLTSAHGRSATLSILFVVPLGKPPISACVAEDKIACLTSAGVASGGSPGGEQQRPRRAGTPCSCRRTGSCRGPCRSTWT